MKIIKIENQIKCKPKSKSNQTTPAEAEFSAIIH